MLWLVTLFSCISAFLFGYDLGLIGGALPRIHEDLNTSGAIDEVIVGGAKLGAVVGAVVGAVMMKVYGRKVCMVWDVVFFLIGPVCMVVVGSFWWLILVGRVVQGVGIGISAVVVPAYLGEISPAVYRGRIVGSYELFLCFGMLASSLVDALMDSMSASWQWMVGFPLVPALVMGVFVWKIPESPRWLVSEGRLEEALRVMHRIHTSTSLDQGVHHSTAEVEAELMDLWSSVQHEAASRECGTVEMAEVKDDAPLLTGHVASSVMVEEKKGGGRFWWAFFVGCKDIVVDLRDLVRGDERRAFVVVMVLAMFNQASGSTSVINYAPTLFEEQGVESSAKASLIASLIGASKLIGVVVAFVLVDRAGRRFLLIFGSVGSSVCLALLAVSDAISSVTLLAIWMCLFIFFFSMSWAEVFWIILAEVFSMKHKSAAMAACTATLFMFGSAADLLFLTIRSSLGFFSFVLYSIIALLGGVFVFLYLPETKGKSLKEVQQAFCFHGS